MPERKKASFEANASSEFSKLSPEDLQELHDIHDASPGVASMLSMAFSDSPMERSEVVRANSREHDVLGKVSPMSSAKPSPEQSECSESDREESTPKHRGQSSLKVPQQRAPKSISFQSNASLGRAFSDSPMQRSLVVRADGKDHEVLGKVSPNVSPQPSEHGSDPEEQYYQDDGDDSLEAPAVGFFDDLASFVMSDTPRVQGAPPPQETLHQLHDLYDQSPGVFSSLGKAFDDDGPQASETYAELQNNFSDQQLQQLRHMHDSSPGVFSTLGQMFDSPAVAQQFVQMSAGSANAASQSGMPAKTASDASFRFFRSMSKGGNTPQIQQQGSYDVGMFSMLGAAFDGDSPQASQHYQQLQERMSPEYLEQLRSVHDKSPGVFSMLGQAFDSPVSRMSDARQNTPQQQNAQHKSASFGAPSPGMFSMIGQAFEDSPHASQQYAELQNNLAPEQLDQLRQIHDSSPGVFSMLGKAFDDSPQYYQEYGQQFPAGMSSQGNNSLDFVQGEVGPLNPVLEGDTSEAVVVDAAVVYMEDDENDGISIVDSNVSVVHLEDDANDGIPTGRVSVPAVTVEHHQGIGQRNFSFGVTPKQQKVTPKQAAVPVEHHQGMGKRTLSFGVTPKKEGSLTFPEKQLGKFVRAQQSLVLSEDSASSGQSKSSVKNVFSMIATAFDADSPQAGQYYQQLQNSLSPEDLQQLHDLHDKSPGVFSMIGQAFDSPVSRMSGARQDTLQQQNSSIKSSSFHARSPGMFSMIGQAFEDSPQSNQHYAELQNNFAPEQLDQLRQLHDHSPGVFSMLGNAFEDSPQYYQESQQFRAGMSFQGNNSFDFVGEVGNNSLDFVGSTSPAKSSLKLDSQGESDFSARIGQMIKDQKEQVAKAVLKAAEGPKKPDFVHIQASDSGMQQQQHRARSSKEGSEDHGDGGVVITPGGSRMTKADYVDKAMNSGKPDDYKTTYQKGIYAMPSAGGADDHSRESATLRERAKNELARKLERQEYMAKVSYDGKELQQKGEALRQLEKDRKGPGLDSVNEKILRMQANLDQQIAEANIDEPRESVQSISAAMSKSEREMIAERAEVRKFSVTHDEVLGRVSQSASPSDGMQPSSCSAAAGGDGRIVDSAPGQPDPSSRQTSSVGRSGFPDLEIAERNRSRKLVTADNDTRSKENTPQFGPQDEQHTLMPAGGGQPKQMPSFHDRDEAMAYLASHFGVDEHGHKGAIPPMSAAQPKQMPSYTAMAQLSRKTSFDVSYDSSLSSASQTLVPRQAQAEDSAASSESQTLVPQRSQAGEFQRKTPQFGGVIPSSNLSRKEYNRSITLEPSNCHTMSLSKGEEEEETLVPGVRQSMTSPLEEHARASQDFQQHDEDQQNAHHSRQLTAAQLSHDLDQLEARAWKMSHLHNADQTQSGETSTQQHTVQRQETVGEADRRVTLPGEPSFSFAGETDRRVTLPGEPSFPDQGNAQLAGRPSEPNVPFPQPPPPYALAPDQQVRGISPVAPRKSMANVPIQSPDPHPRYEGTQSPAPAAPSPAEPHYQPQRQESPPYDDRARQDQRYPQQQMAPPPMVPRTTERRQQEIEIITAFDREIKAIKDELEEAQQARESKRKKKHRRRMDSSDEETVEKALKSAKRAWKEAAESRAAAQETAKMALDIATLKNQLAANQAQMLANQNQVAGFNAVAASVAADVTPASQAPFAQFSAAQGSTSRIIVQNEGGTPAKSEEMTHGFRNLVEACAVAMAAYNTMTEKKQQDQPPPPPPPPQPQIQVQPQLQVQAQPQQPSWGAMPPPWAQGPGWWGGPWGYGNWEEDGEPYSPSYYAKGGKSKGKGKSKGNASFTSPPEQLSPPASPSQGASEQQPQQRDGTPGEAQGMSADKIQELVSKQVSAQVAELEHQQKLQSMEQDHKLETLQQKEMLLQQQLVQQQQQLIDAAAASKQQPQNLNQQHQNVLNSNRDPSPTAPPAAINGLHGSGGVGAGLTYNQIGAQNVLQPVVPAATQMGYDILLQQQAELAQAKRQLELSKQKKSKGGAKGGKSGTNSPKGGKAKGKGGNFQEWKAAQMKKRNLAAPPEMPPFPMSERRQQGGSPFRSPGQSPGGRSPQQMSNFELVEEGTQGWVDEWGEWQTGWYDESGGWVDAGQWQQQQDMIQQQQSEAGSPQSDGSQFLHGGQEPYQESNQSGDYLPEDEPPQPPPPPQLDLPPAPVPPVGTWVELRCTDTLMPGDRLAIGTCGLVLNQGKISPFASKPRPDWHGPGPFIGVDFGAHWGKYILPASHLGPSEDARILQIGQKLHNLEQNANNGRTPNPEDMAPILQKRLSDLQMKNSSSNANIESELTNESGREVDLIPSVGFFAPEQQAIRRHQALVGDGRNEVHNDANIVRF